MRRTCFFFASNRDPLRWARGWRAALGGRHFRGDENIDFNRPFHVGAKSALLLLSNCDPLRWARSWQAALRAFSENDRF